MDFQTDLPKFISQHRQSWAFAFLNKNIVMKQVVNCEMFLFLLVLLLALMLLFWHYVVVVGVHFDDVVNDALNFVDVAAAVDVGAVVTNAVVVAVGWRAAEKSRRVCLPPLGHCHCLLPIRILVIQTVGLVGVRVSLATTTQHGIIQTNKSRTKISFANIDSSFLGQLHYCVGGGSVWVPRVVVMYDKLLKAIVLALPPLHVQSTERQITSVVLTLHCSGCCLLIKISSLPPLPLPLTHTSIICHD